MKISFGVVLCCVLIIVFGLFWYASIVERECSCKSLTTEDYSHIEKMRGELTKVHGAELVSMRDGSVLYVLNSAYSLISGTVYKVVTIPRLGQGEGEIWLSSDKQLYDILRLVKPEDKDYLSFAAAYLLQ